MDASSLFSQLVHCKMNLVSRLFKAPARREEARSSVDDLCQKKWFLATRNHQCHPFPKQRFVKKGCRNKKLGEKFKQETISAIRCPH